MSYFENTLPFYPQYTNEVISTTIKGLRIIPRMVSGAWEG